MNKAPRTNFFPLKAKDPVIAIETGAFSDKGNKAENEDRFVIFEKLSQFSDEENNSPFRKHSYSFFAVYDGHGGSASAQYLETHLHHNLIEELHTVKDFSSDADPNSPEHIEFVKEVLVNAFLKTDRDLLEELKRRGKNDGSTAVVCLLVDDVAWVANVGDSKAVLTRERGKRPLKIGRLSKDHSPDFLEERRRIEKRGGFVKEGRVLGRLAVSRSFGDPTLKQYGVSATPYVSRVQLDAKRDSFLLLGCDGVWSHMAIKETVDFAHGELLDFSKPSAREVSRRLVKHAVMSRGAADNVTVVLLKIAGNAEEEVIKKEE
ncbi:hypothetical protein MHBO_002127 [Bonamia ostreae]|uniref:PPM-type phosphatase domain-containing protein n=1 Tax=Bonamia ostreae TaxID=126728 RepID=A0ABV2ALB9_9EUKA